MMRGRRWLVPAVAAALLCAALPARADRPQQVELPSGAQMVYQPAAAPAQRYTPVVLLPYTGGSAQDLYRWKYRDYFNRHGKPGVSFILPQKAGDFSDYKTGSAWARTVGNWEAELQSVLNEAAAQLPLDRDRVVLAGFSMGGDMAWALMQRQPERYAGAVIMGSRCTWRESGSPEKLADSAVRVAFSVGDKEREARRRGAQLARSLLEKFGVLVRWDNVPGSHLPAPGKLFAEQVDFVLQKLPAVPTVAQVGDKPAGAASLAP
jgi:predicted esterase